MFARQRRLSNRNRLEYSKLEPKLPLATITLAGGELRIFGTSGDDSVVVRELDILDIDGPTENNISVTDAGQAPVFFNRFDIDSIEFFGLDGNDNFSYVAETLSGTAVETIELVGFYGGEGDDNFFYSSNEFVTEVLGIGGGGNDRLEADRLVPGAVLNSVRFFGSDGDDILMGAFGDDTLVGGAGADEIFGGVGDDFLSGGEGDDELDGGIGDDMLVGGAGDDLLLGGDAGATTDVFPSPLEPGGDDVIFGGAGNDTLIGGDGADRLYGGVDDDVSFGGIGDDIINSFEGDDDLFGGAGNDRLVGGNGNDLLNGFGGDDTLLGQAGNDRLFGVSGTNRLIGGAGNDVLFGGTGFDVVFGGEGVDWIGNALEDNTDFDEEEDLRDVSLADFVFISLSEASALATTLGRDFRIVFLDGVEQSVTSDVIPTRLNFSVSEGLVTAVFTDTGNAAGLFGDEFIGL